MKQQQKTTVTLSMIWLASMVIIATPEWIRAALDFVRGSTSTTVANAGGAASTGGGSNAGLK